MSLNTISNPNMCIPTKHHVQFPQYTTLLTATGTSCSSHGVSRGVRLYCRDSPASRWTTPCSCTRCFMLLEWWAKSLYRILPGHLTYCFPGHTGFHREHAEQPGWCSALWGVHTAVSMNAWLAVAEWIKLVFINMPILQYFIWGFPPQIMPHSKWKSHM